MITEKNLETYLTKATFKKNKGAMPKVGSNQWVITKFNDGSYGHERHVHDYYWGYGTAYPIMEYAVVDLIPSPVEFEWPVFNSVRDILPEAVVECTNDTKISLNVLVSLCYGEFAVAYLQCTEDCPPKWFSTCSEGWDMTDRVRGWLPLPDPAILV